MSTDLLTPQESKLLTDTLLDAGMCAALFGMGVVSTAKEFTAFLKLVKETVDGGSPDSTLVKLLKATGEATAGEAEKKSPEGVLASAKGATELARARMAKADADAYVAFLVKAAETSCSASGSGWLGSGEKVSPEEKAFLAELKTAVGV